ncbi:MAG TPA: hypothetical protein VFI44_06265 [Ornithinibacter sp.]|nr:hypothetical protein [Ornithinibacter sp.]
MFTRDRHAPARASHCSPGRLEVPLDKAATTTDAAGTASADTCPLTGTVLSGLGVVVLSHVVRDDRTPVCDHCNPSP